MSRILLVFVFTIITSLSFAQDDMLLFPAAHNLDSSSVFKTVATQVGQQGKVRFEHAPGIDSLLALEKKINLKKDGQDGFRVLVFRGNEGAKSRHEAEEMKSRFLALFPDVKIYTIYNSPNFKLLVGDYRTYATALKKKVELEKAMPDLKGEIFIRAAKIVTSYN